MSRTTSSALRTMAHSQESGQVLLALIEISHSTIIGGPLRLVQDVKPIVSAGNVYTAFPFQIVLPDDNEQATPRVKLIIDAVDQSIMTAIRTMPPGEPPTITVSIVLASQPDVVEMSMTGMVLRTVMGTQDRIEGELLIDEEDLLRFPEGSFTPFDFPGMFS
jgi:Domain of unknown function (DUF1833)